MSGPPPGPGGPGARSMSVSNGPPSAGMPPPQHMQSQQANVPPPAGASGGSQSQQNLNQIVGPFSSSYLLFALSSTYYPPTATGSPLEPNSMKSSHAEAHVDFKSTSKCTFEGVICSAYGVNEEIFGASLCLHQVRKRPPSATWHILPEFASRMQLRRPSTSATISP